MEANLHWNSVPFKAKTFIYLTLHILEINTGSREPQVLVIDLAQYISDFWCLVFFCKKEEKENFGICQINVIDFYWKYLTVKRVLGQLSSSNKQFNLWKRKLFKNLVWCGLFSFLLHLLKKPYNCSFCHCLFSHVVTMFWH